MEEATRSAFLESMWDLYDEKAQPIPGGTTAARKPAVVFSFVIIISRPLLLVLKRFKSTVDNR
jgi:hypothetical protein